MRFMNINFFFLSMFTPQPVYDYTQTSKQIHEDDEKKDFYDNF